MSAKLSIELFSNKLDIEGEEEFIYKVFTDFKDLIIKNKTLAPAKNIFNVEEADTSDNSLESVFESEKSNTAKKIKTKNKTTSKNNKSTFSLVADFYEGEIGRNFTKYLKEIKLPKAHQEIITYFVYIMQKVGVKDITLDHVFTAYKLASMKTPGDLRSSLNNARNRGGWLIINGDGIIRTHHKGDELVEFAPTQNE